MADTFIQVATDGSGKKLDTRTEGTNSEHRQVIVIGDPATNANVAAVSATTGLRTNTSITDGTNSITLLQNAAGTSDFAVPVMIHPDSVNANGQTTMANSAPVTIASDQSTISVNGNVAHDAVDSGNPQKIGGKASNVEPAAVSATGDRANCYTDMVGKLVVLPYANPENFVSGAITTAMTGTTSTSLVAAPASGLRNYITTIIASNAHATVGTDIVIQDGSGGTTLLTIPAAAVYGGSVITLPVPLRQPTTATAIFCANVTTGASTKVSAVGYKGV